MSIVEISGLKKRYGRTLALDGLDMSIEKGEIYGFIGPNGAGKSTTIRILLGLLRHESGSIALFGGDPWKDAAELHRRLAYVPSDVNLWGNLTGGEVIDLLSRMRGPLNEQRLKKLVERFDLDPTKKCHSYSKGNRQKVALISAFVSDVELYVLDEPTSGLDPLMELVFQQMVLEQKAEGKAVLLSSHILSEVDALCDHVGIIKRGRMVGSGAAEMLRGMSLEAFFEKYYQNEV